MPIPVAWSPSFGFNFRLADSQTLLRAVQLRDGSFWVVWTDNKDTGVGSPAGSDLVGQRYDVFGQPLGGEVRLNNNFFVDNERNASLAADVGSNEFFIAYEDLNADGSTDLILERKNADGSALGFATIASDPDNTNGGVGFRNPQVAVASATSGLIIFERTELSGTIVVVGQRFDPSTGILVGSAFTINAGGLGSAQDAEIVVTSDGRYAVIYEEGSEVRGRFVNADGTLAATFFVGSSASDPSVAALADGRLVVSWTTNGNIPARIIAADGTGGTTFNLMTTADVEDSSRIVATGPDSFVVAWQNRSTDQVFLTNYLTSGASSFFQSGLSTAAAGVESVSALALLGLADGRVLLGYDAPLGVAQIWDARSNANTNAVYAPNDYQIGTPGNDIFTAAAGASVVHGWDGNDDITDGPGTETQIFGGNGNDVIRISFVDASDANADGGPGFDTLVYTALAGPTTVHLGAGTATTGAATQSVTNFEHFFTNVAQDVTVTAGDGPAFSDLTTGSGNDTLDLGISGGTMTGGAGNDIYRVDTVNDNIVEQLVGGGTDTVTTGLTNYTLPLNVEILTYIGSAAATLRGNIGFNTISGGPLADLILLQDGGTDTAAGGAGNDGFYFGAAYNSADSVDGGAGTLDQIGLQGNYDTGPLTLGTITGVEYIVLLPGNDNRFGGATGTLLSYDLVTTDANIAAGQILTVQANTLRAGENFRLNAAAETDGSVLTFGGLGIDTITGGQQGDGFYFGTGRFGASDILNGQGGSDQLGLQGNFAGANALTFGATQLSSIEFIVLLSASDTRFGGGNSAQSFSYTLTMNNGNVAAGQQMVIQANTLRAGEVLSFDGSAETNGTFLVFGGQNDDSIIGGQLGDNINGNPGADRIEGRGGADVLRGGTGPDVFIYRAISESTAAARDRIADFSIGDLIDLSFVDANSVSAGGQAFELIESGQAFTGAGQLRITQAGTAALIEGDSDGDLLADFAIEVTVTDGHALGLADFSGVSDNQAADLVVIEPNPGDETWLWSETWLGSAKRDPWISLHLATPITGKGGADQLTGGADTDIFRYLQASDLTTVARDQFLDFVSGEQVHVARLAADTGGGTVGLIDGGAWTGPRQVQVAQNGNAATASMIIDGDAVADTVIDVVVSEGNSLTPADFFVLSALVDMGGKTSAEPDGGLSIMLLADKLAGFEKSVSAVPANLDSGSPSQTIQLGGTLGRAGAYSGDPVDVSLANHAFIGAPLELSHIAPTHDLLV